MQGEGFIPPLSIRNATCSFHVEHSIELECSQNIWVSIEDGKLVGKKFMKWVVTWEGSSLVSSLSSTCSSSSLLSGDMTTCLSTGADAEGLG